ncbi:MAG: FeoB-associated Cys-rich membrane protein [Oscillospiraceae bacterium]|nr:FeoB-associated Cys-rich membrane protein [Oscillospiraceae bacterium]
MVNAICTAIVIAAVGAALLYIRRQKKKGKCVGCPCSGKATCHCDIEKK